MSSRVRAVGRCGSMCECGSISGMLQISRYRSLVSASVNMKTSPGLRPLDGLANPGGACASAGTSVLLLQALVEMTNQPCSFYRFARPGPPANARVTAAQLFKPLELVSVNELLQGQAVGLVS